MTVLSFNFFFLIYLNPKLYIILCVFLLKIICYNIPSWLLHNTKIFTSYILGYLHEKKINVLTGNVLQSFYLIIIK